MKDYQRQQIHNRVISSGTARISLGETCRYLMVASAVAALLITYPWMNSEIISLGYQIQELKRDNSMLREQQRALMLEQAAYTSPQRIDQYAREHLGLVPASSAQVIFIRDAELLPDQGVLAESLAPASAVLRETRQ